MGSLSVLDLDGDLDLLAGNNGLALSNDGHGGVAAHRALFDPLQTNQAALVDIAPPRLVGDLNGDGLKDVVAVPIYSTLLSAPPCLAVQTRHMAHPQPSPPAQIKLAPLDKTVLDGPYASPQIFAASAITFTYTWDVLGSGFFGQSDSVVFRLEARPDLHPQRNGVLGPPVPVAP